MKILKSILFIVLGLIGIILVAAIFIEKEYTVERTVVINRPVDEVYDYLSHLKNQDNFSKWALTDPEMVKTYEGTDAQVGFVSAWKSDHPEVGIGEQEITGLKLNERIDYELRFYEPGEFVNQAYMITEPQGQGNTKVTWGFNGGMDYPMNFMLLFLNFEEMIGNDFQIGLENLKEILES